MRSFLILFLCAVLVAPQVLAANLVFTSEEVIKATERGGIIYNKITVSEAVLDAGRVRKQVIFRGNKSARFAEFENLALAPQQIYAKSLLNSAVAIDDAGVVNYANLPDVNVATAVAQVETKITKRVANNPAITGYGRTKNDVYGSLGLKRTRDARTQAALQQKLSQFQVKASRMQEKLQRVQAQPESDFVASLN